MVGAHIILTVAAGAVLGIALGVVGTLAALRPWRGSWRLRPAQKRASVACAVDLRGLSLWLEDAFDVVELHHVVRWGPEGDGVLRFLPQGCSKAQLCLEVVEAWRRRGLLDASLRDYLAGERPSRSTEVKALFKKKPPHLCAGGSGSARTVSKRRGCQKIELGTGLGGPEQLWLGPAHE